MLTIRLEVILWTRVIVRWRFTDPKAVNKLQVAQTTASYKMHQNGLAGGLEKQLFDKLKEGFFFYFSFHIDEATSATLHKVLTLLASYFCSTKK